MIIAIALLIILLVLLWIDEINHRDPPDDSDSFKPNDHEQTR